MATSAQYPWKHQAQAQNQALDGAVEERRRREKQTDRPTGTRGARSVYTCGWATEGDCERENACAASNNPWREDPFPPIPHIANPYHPTVGPIPWPPQLPSARCN